MIELLENRIAPAAVITFTESDGDKIKVSTSKGTNAELIAAFNGGIGNGATNVDTISLDFTTSLDFANTNVNIAVVKHGIGSDKLADNITINGYDETPAEGHSNVYFKNINIQGNLLSIDAGNDSQFLGINKLTVKNWGPMTDGIAAIPSAILGGIGKVLVKGDFNGFISSATDYTNSTVGAAINSFHVKGSIASTLGDDNGHIQVAIIGSLTVDQVFFGPGSGGNANNGLIEAIAVYNSFVPDMEQGAQIITVQDTASAPA